MAAQFAADAFMDLLAEPVSGGLASVRRRTKKFVWRNRRGLLSAALLAGLAVAALIWQGLPPGSPLAKPVPISLRIDPPLLFNTYADNRAGWDAVARKLHEAFEKPGA